MRLQKGTSYIDVVALAVPLSLRRYGFTLMEHNGRYSHCFGSWAFERFSVSFNGHRFLHRDPDVASSKQIFFFLPSAFARKRCFLGLRYTLLSLSSAHLSWCRLMDRPFCASAGPRLLSGVFASRGWRTLYSFGNSFLCCHSFATGPAPDHRLPDTK